MSHPSIASARLQSLIEQIRNRITEGVPQYSANGEHLTKQPTPEEIEEQKRVEREKEKIQRDLEDRIKDLEVELNCAKRKEEEASKVVADYAKKQVQRELVGSSKIIWAGNANLYNTGSTYMTVRRIWTWRYKSKRWIRRERDMRKKQSSLDRNDKSLK